jgi:hypothetical protein
MDNIHIERVLKHQPNFQGVFSSDTLPTTPRLLVCNTDPERKPGQHWIAISVDKNGRGEYFDSFGRPPNKHFERYMNSNCKRWSFNKRQLKALVQIPYKCTYMALAFDSCIELYWMRYMLFVKIIEIGR